MAEAAYSGSTFFHYGTMNTEREAARGLTALSSRSDA